VTANEQRSQAARARHPEATVEPSADRLWQDPGRHGLVVVATANDSHLALATRAIEAGIPVVVDKPLTLDSGSAGELVDLAERHSVPLTVFHNRRWDSDLLTLRKLIADGSLGDVHRFESRFERWRPELTPGAWREERTRAEGGGLLLDLGTHLVDQALLLFGPARDVYGEVRSVRGGPADDDVFIALRHDSGVHSHIWASSVAAEPGPRMRALGSRGGFVVDALDSQEEALKGNVDPGGRWGVEPPERWGRLTGPDGESVAIESVPGAWPTFYEQVAGALDGGGELPVDPRDAVRVLEVLERAAGG
jgi:predicted dehydrogenase